MEERKDTSNQPVLGHIERLVAEEHKLYNQGTFSEEDRSRPSSRARSMLGPLAAAPRPTRIRTGSEDSSGTLSGNRRTLRGVTLRSFAETLRQKT